MSEANETVKAMNEAIEMNNMYERCKDRLEYKNQIIKQLIGANAVGATSRIERIFKNNESRCPCDGMYTFTSTPEAPSISDAFTWSETKEGFNYWSNVEGFLNSSQN